MLHLVVLTKSKTVLSFFKCGSYSAILYLAGQATIHVHTEHMEGLHWVQEKKETLLT